MNPYLLSAKNHNHKSGFLWYQLTDTDDVVSKILIVLIFSTAD